MDQALLQFIVDHRIWPLDDLAQLLKVIGQSAVSFVLVVVGTYVTAYRRQQWAWAAAISLAAGGALVASAVGKALIDRPRPPVSDALLVAHGSAMPSSVAVLCAALGVAVLAGWDRGGAPVDRRALALVVGVVAIFGVAVVYLAAHWVSDVLVGWALGAAIGAAAVPLGARLAAVIMPRVPFLTRPSDRDPNPSGPPPGRRPT